MSNPLDDTIGHDRVTLGIMGAAKKPKWQAGGYARRAVSEPNAGKRIVLLELRRLVRARIR
jgi:hypothetical protein